MAWSAHTTMFSFLMALFVAVMLGVKEIMLMKDELKNQRITYQYRRILVGVVGAHQMCGLGCTWFKIYRKRVVWVHASLTIIALLLMVQGAREEFELEPKGPFYDRRNCMITYGLYVYAAQLALTVHLVILRFGRTPARRAFCIGLHSYFGIITYLSTAVYGVALWRRYIWRYGAEYNFDYDAYIPLFYGLFFSAVVLFVLLNPYYDWRRLRAFERSDEAQEEA